MLCCGKKGWKWNPEGQNYCCDFCGKDKEQWEKNKMIEIKSLYLEGDSEALHIVLGVAKTLLSEEEISVIKLQMRLNDEM